MAPTTLIPNTTLTPTTPILNMTTTLNISDLSNTTDVTDGYQPETKQQMMRDFWIGLMLAVVSSVFTGSSFILKKRGLLNVGRKQAVRAGDGGFQYLKEWLWWAGMIIMILGEVMNFAAYTLAPATLVTPLGALSVISSAIMSTYFLNERLNLLGKVGCLQCLLGSTIMVINSPKEQEIQNMAELLDKLIEPGIIILVILMLIIAFIFMFVLVPKYGQKNVLVYLVVCSIFGAFNVTGCKGLGVAIKETALGRNEFTNWLTYVMLAIVIICILLELNYLNRSLDLYNTAIVTPTYYVIFTSTVILVSLVLFKEFENLTPENIVGNFCGFITIVAGIFLLNAFKHMKVSLRTLPKAQKRLPSHSSHNGDVMATVVHDDDQLLEDNENQSPDEEKTMCVMPGYVDPEVFQEQEVETE